MPTAGHWAGLLDHGFVAIRQNGQLCLVGDPYRAAVPELPWLPDFGLEVRRVDPGWWSEETVGYVFTITEAWAGCRLLRALSGTSPGVRRDRMFIKPFLPPGTSMRQLKARVLAAERREYWCRRDEKRRGCTFPRECDLTDGTPR